MHLETLFIWWMQNITECAHCAFSWSNVCFFLSFMTTAGYTVSVYLRIQYQFHHFGTSQSTGNDLKQNYLQQIIKNVSSE